MIIRRELNSGSNDINVVYRPYRIDELLGNETNKRILKNGLDKGNLKHTLLFTGYAGCGKTTAAKIVALSLNCDDNGVSSTPCLKCKSCLSIMEGSNTDVCEINVGKANGKAHVEKIVEGLSWAPFQSRYKVIIFDEAHKLTSDAKDLLLKPIEHGYDHVYFIFCTDQPEKLIPKSKTGKIPPFLSRCGTLNFKTLDEATIMGMLHNVCEFEGYTVKEEILGIISEMAGGVPRIALVWLDQIASEGSWSREVALEICNSSVEEEDPQIIEIAQALNKGDFKSAVAIYDKIKNVMAVESVRIAVTGYFVACLRKARTVIEGITFSEMLDILVEPIYEPGKLAEHRWHNYMFKVALAARRKGK